MVQNAVVVLIERRGDQFAFERSCDVGTRLDENQAEGTGTDSFLILKRSVFGHAVFKNQTGERKAILE